MSDFNPTRAFPVARGAGSIPPPAQPSTVVTPVQSSTSGITLELPPNSVVQLVPPNPDSTKRNVHLYNSGLVPIWIAGSTNVGYQNGHRLNAGDRVTLSTSGGLWGAVKAIAIVGISATPTTALAGKVDIVDGL